MPRAAHKDVDVTIGPMLNFTCDLISPTVSARSKEGKARGKIETKMACPTCYGNTTTSLAKQQYVCENYPDHGPFQQGELAKAVVNPDGSLTTLGLAKEVDAARKLTVADESPTGELKIDFTPHAADDVFASTYPGPLSWIVRPPKKSGKAAFESAVAIAAESGRIDVPDGDPICLIGSIVLDGKKRWLRLDRWGNQLVFRELYRPDELKTGLEMNTDEPDPRLAMARQFIATFSAPFNADQLIDASNARLQTWVGERLGDGWTVDATLTDDGLIVPKKETSVDELLSMMEAVVNNQKDNNQKDKVAA